MRTELKIGVVAGLVVIVGAMVLYIQQNNTPASQTEIPLDLTADARNVNANARTPRERTPRSAERNPAFANPQPTVRSREESRSSPPQVQEPVLPPTREVASTPPSSPSVSLPPIQASHTEPQATREDRSSSEAVTLPRPTEPEIAGQPPSTTPERPTNINVNGVALPLRPDGTAPIRTHEPGPVTERPITPPIEPVRVPAVTPDSSAAQGTTYTVLEGDTLIAIARSELGDESAWRKIVEMNPGLDPQRLLVGNKIKLPPKGSLTAARRPTEPARTPAEPPAARNSPALTPPERSQPTVDASGARTYRVAKGDTLISIARNTLKDESRWVEIYALNRAKLKSQDHLVVGMELKLPPTVESARNTGANTSP